MSRDGLTDDVKACFREYGELVLALRVVRSLVHNLPRSKTAQRIDDVCADALQEPRTP